MGLISKRLLPVGSRRRAWARRAYAPLAALTGGRFSDQPALPRSLTPDALSELEATLRMSFFNRQPPGYLETEQGFTDMANHLTNRLQNAQLQVVPWLESVTNLHGARVLEIGCGTGSGLVALAERGAQVIGVDVDEGALEVARKRCSLHGVVAELHAANATSVAEAFAG